MGKHAAEPNRLTRLRQRADARREAVDIPDMSPEEVRHLVHELQTHQIELELQNEELRRAQDELVESRDRYSDLYDFAPVGYVTVSDKGLILEANLALAEMLGVERASLMQQPLSAFIVLDDQDIFYRHRLATLESKQRDTCRLRMVGRNATTFWTELDSILIEAGDEQCGRLRAVIRDVTEQTQAERETVTLERQLQHAQKLESLGVLAGGIAHDFHNLLMVILGRVELALDEVTNMSPVREHLQEIEKASIRSAELTNQMLAYSGQGRFVIELIDIGRLVEEMAQMLEVTISKKAKLVYDFAERLPQLTGDVTQIRQVVMNLITNASEAIGDNSGVITLSTGSIDVCRASLDDVDQVLSGGLDTPPAEGLYTYLEVTDTGCGMNSQTIEKIFDPFFTTKFTGRGLGMSAVQGIVRGHQGTLTIHSDVGRGTTFRVLFPAEQSPPTGCAVRSNPDSKDWRGSGTVLLADDEPTIRTVGKLMLERLGYSVLTARNGREALNLFGQHADDIVCVLLDWTMPDMNGAEAFHELTRLHPGVQVILCSGYNEQDITAGIAGKGLAGFIHKPFDLTALQAKLREVLRSTVSRPGETPAGRDTGPIR